MKTWEVTTRGADGKPEIITVSAETRQEAFAELAKMGKNAIRVEESTGKKAKRAVRPTSSVSGKRGPLVPLLIIMGLGAVVAFLLFNFQSEKPRSKKTPVKVSSGIAEVKPAISTNKPVAVVESNATKRIDINKVYRDANGKVIYNPEAPVGSPANPIKYGWVDRPGNHRPPKKLYDTFPENYLVGLLRTKPGMPVVGIRLPRNFDEMFKARIADPVGFKEDDTEEDKEMRRLVKQVKEDMAVMMGQGMTPSEILLSERAELNKLARMKSTVLREISTLRKSGASQEEIDLAVEAGNKLLDRYGVEHIKIPAILRGTDLTNVKEQK